MRYAKLSHSLLVAPTPMKINNIHKLKLQFNFLSLIVEIFPSFEIHWFIITSDCLMTILSSHSSVQGQLQDQFIFASKCLGQWLEKCLGQFLEMSGFYSCFKCIHCSYSYLCDYSVSQVSSAGKRQCIMMTKIGEAPDFTWIHLVKLAWG